MNSILLLLILAAFSVLPDSIPERTAESSKTEQSQAVVTIAGNGDSVAKPSNKKAVPPVVHSRVGDKSAGFRDSLQLVNIKKLQQYDAGQRDSFDKNIFSPKSVSYSPDGKYVLINSLEGCNTSIYDASTFENVSVINYRFPSGKGSLWGNPSPLYQFSHYPDGENRAFSGKPVEMEWSHNGRYLWVPFYRRSFDINAQDPSAIAAVDMNSFEIVRMMETGPLPKMVAASHDGKNLAITHWGDNTVGLVDISSNSPQDWKHIANIPASFKLKPDYSLTESVDRDSKSGWLLRGTVFTPDDRYLLVSGMAGPLSVFDVRKRQFLGTFDQLIGIRHLVIGDGYLFGSRNIRGDVIKISLSDITAAIEKGVKYNTKHFTLDKKIEVCQVGKGTRTIHLTPDGKYIFAACNSASAVFAVDANSMQVVDSIRCDSYPVGLYISPDGRQMAVTSQGRDHNGGNAVNFFSIIRPDHITINEPDSCINELPAEVMEKSSSEKVSFFTSVSFKVIAAAAILIILLILGFVLRRRKNQ